WAEPYRARRIYDLLRTRMKLSVSDFEQIQGDTYSTPEAILAGAIVKMAKRSEASSPDWTHLVAECENWDGRASADSRPMLILAFIRRRLASQILESAFGASLGSKYSWPNVTFFDQVIQDQSIEWLPKQYKTYPDFVLACYRQALERLKNRFGPDESTWKWGAFAKVRFPHPLAEAPLIGLQFRIPEFPETGGSAAVNNGSTVSMRFIADLSNWDNTRLGIPLGESGDPKSLHWKDQLDDWRNVTPAGLAFSRSAVRAASKQKLVLKPAM
ncbi:MAG TPA: penicillin acylase family protein, partial [Blastocatellia bacterium]|nr:penicillin acylase family protein [Blastocatellia bacterium]